MKNTNDVEAVFIDELDRIRSDFIHELKMLSTSINIIWVALDIPSTELVEHVFYWSNVDSFTHIKLKVNLRNSKEIVVASEDKRDLSMTFQSREVETIGSQLCKSLRTYFNGLFHPPINFPRGRPTITVNSLKKAISKARELTSGGLLVLNVEYEEDLKKEVLQSMIRIAKEKWKFHEDIQESENAYELLTEGYVLFATCYDAAGFEWPTVICFGKDECYYTPTPDLQNMFMRCTTNLIVIET